MPIANPRLAPAGRIALVLALALLAALAACEAAGWPFLAAPLQGWLSQRLERSVGFSSTAGGAPSGFRLKLLGAVRLGTPVLRIGAPAWSEAPHFLLAHDAQFEWAYGDLWRAWRGQPLHTRRVHARTLDLQAERRADGRASWALRPAGAAAEDSGLPSVAEIRIADATLRLDDLVQQLQLDAQAVVDTGFRLSARGRYKDMPLQGSASAPSLSASAVVSARLSIGRASLSFDGTGSALPRLDRLEGRFSMQGPSLAALGDPVGVTLPTTGPFRASGQVRRQPGRWDVEFSTATVGNSSLGGRFVFETQRPVPMLSGELRGTRLLLVDLGPVVGVAPAASAPRLNTRVLPSRPFDLAALRVMDARVDVHIDEVDLNTRWLEPVRPLKAQLRLGAGVLSLADLDARTGQGKLVGSLHLDGREAQALWLADLRWSSLRLERWLRAPRTAPTASAPPSGAARGPATWATGRLDGSASLRGRGTSTAGILATLEGNLRTQLHEGSLSHLVVEAAGLDLAQALGVMIRGDRLLPVTCGLADLAVSGGVMRPRVMVLDTADSAIWVDGSLSLASERIDLRAVVTPRDFSPLTLRTPLQLGGSFAAPTVSIDKGKLAGTLATSLLLALLNPLAAVIPLLDPGNDAAATQGAAPCHDIVDRAAKRAPAR